MYRWNTNRKTTYKNQVLSYGSLVPNDDAELLMRVGFELEEIEEPARAQDFADLSYKELKQLALASGYEMSNGRKHEDFLNHMGGLND